MFLRVLRPLYSHPPTTLAYTIFPPPGALSLPPPHTAHGVRARMLGLRTAAAGALIPVSGVRARMLGLRTAAAGALIPVSGVRAWMLGLRTAAAGALIPL
jgi:hypothetical protein